MKTSLARSLLLLAAACIALTAVPSAFAAETTLKFSDPAKPGRVVVQVGMGDVTIVGQDTTVVKVTDDEDKVDDKPEPRGDGMRRLDGDGGFSTSESNNVITVSFANMLMHGRGRHGGANADVSITVPHATSVTIERMGPGDMVVKDVAGDVEIRGAIGDVELEGISGGVVVESVNGDVEARFAALAADRPVSINVVHGDVELHVPADTKANVSLRTLRGEMLTNFSEDELETSYNPSPGIEDDDAPTEGQVEADHKRALADHDRALADRERAMADARKRGPSPHPFPVPPVPPIPPLPPMAGGKLVAGTLNGGGTTLNVTTLTGDITLRKVE